MNRRTLLILAAAPYQVPVIQRAKQMGLRVITLDNRPENPGHAISDIALDVDTTDRERVLKEAIAHKIDGILAPCTDIAVPTAAYVAEIMELPGPPLAVADLLCDKALFASRLEEIGLGRPGTRLLDPTDKDSGELFPDKFPLIVKPVRSSGGRGITVVHDSTLLANALDHARETCVDHVLIEEYINGQQLTIEGIIQDGKLTVSMVTDRLVAKEPHVATCAHLTPSDLPEPVQRQVQVEVTKLLTSLGVRSTIFDADVIWDGDRVWILELSPRLGGNGLTHLWPIATGVDIIKCAIQLAIGEKPDCTPSPAAKAAGVAVLGMPHAGLVPWTADSASRAAAITGVEHIELDYSPNTPVAQYQTGRDRIGLAVVSGNDRMQIRERLELLSSTLGITKQNWAPTP